MNESGVSSGENDSDVQPDTNVQSDTETAVVDDPAEPGTEHRDPGDHDDTGDQGSTASVQLGDEIDLDAIGRDLDDVERALERLNDGSYWTDEVTGEQIPDEVLADQPTARTASPTASTGTTTTATSAS